ncbi:pirin domain-containing protein [Pluteus cervinus]|uniref:Pirin domain-containing protein n=1 Tax=Pluteus cervinus TaxID=181527 RepID=A0ACD3AL70_9AGAR|nr:pirin domain-containing protein [Pluteus cervinus]
MKLIPRPSEERGHADHGWLKTFHTFSFATYQSGGHESYGPLRVINEDRVAPRTGFGTHSHREFEIFSYVVSGQLEHKDSMGNVEVLNRGDLQLTSAGTGISHSEKAHGPKQVHFLQIWSVPTQSGLPPKYYTRHFSDSEKTDRWVKVVGQAGSKDVTDKREGEGPAPVHSPLSMYATILGAGNGLDGDAAVALKGPKAYVHVIQTSGYNSGRGDGTTVKVKSGSEEMILREGDGAYIRVDQEGERLKVINSGESAAEIVLFDLE